jgi:hypothetical protein
MIGVLVAFGGSALAFIARPVLKKARKMVNTAVNGDD